MSDCLPLIDTFWAATGPPVIFFTHQPELEENESGAKVRPPTSPHPEANLTYHRASNRLSDSARPAGARRAGPGHNQHGVPLPGREGCVVLP